MSACSWLPLQDRAVTERDPQPATTPRPAPQDMRERQPQPPPVTAPTVASDAWRALGNELRMATAADLRGSDAMAQFGASGAYIAAASERARPFLAYIFAEIERRQLPFEIALIPIVESAYNPAATSPGGAAGIWQFIPATGRRFGLQQSRWYDGRRDVVASTQAALDYFEKLRDRFMGDWKLVFAAYNCGGRTVERAIERNARRGLPTDFYSLELPTTTRAYVPKLLALVEIIAQPAAHGVELAKIPLEPYFEIVDTGGPLDLNQVIAWSGMSATDFDQLNAGFRKRLAIAGTPTRVLVPRAQADAVKQALAELTPSQRLTSREHTVARGETLSHIAAATAIPIAALIEANGLRSNHLAVGQKLLIPDPHQIPLRDDSEDDTAVAAAAPATHRVTSGDNLWTIARRYGTSVASLAARNGLQEGAVLKLGQRLAIPPGAADTASVPDRSEAHYEVRRGDSLWTIARRFKVSILELKRWNRISGEHHLQPGQRLVVARPTTAPAGAQDI